MHGNANDALQEAVGQEVAEAEASRPAQPITMQGNANDALQEAVGQEVAEAEALRASFQGPAKHKVADLRAGEVTETSLGDVKQCAAAEKEEHDAEGGDNTASDAFDAKMGEAAAAEGAVSAAWKVKAEEKKQWAAKCELAHKASTKFRGVECEYKHEANAFALVQKTVAIELNAKGLALSAEVLAQVSIDVGVGVEMQYDGHKVTAEAHAEAAVKAFLKGEAFVGLDGVGGSVQGYIGAMCETKAELNYTYKDAITLKATYKATAIVGAGAEAGFAVKYKDGVCNYACVLAAAAGVGGGIEIELEVDAGKLKALIGDKILRTVDPIRRRHEHTRKYKQVHPISAPAATTGAAGETDDDYDAARDWDKLAEYSITMAGYTEKSAAGAGPLLSCPRPSGGNNDVERATAAATVPTAADIDAQGINMAFWHSI